MIIPVAVEKLPLHEFAEIASRQEALQTIFPGLLDIFYHPIFDFSQEKRVFQQPPLLPTVIRIAASSSKSNQTRADFCVDWDHFGKVRK